MTEVIFRKDKDGVFALFPYLVMDKQGHVTHYSHVGQHSAASYRKCIDNSKPASWEDYSDLKAELTMIGYDLRVVNRINTKKWIKAHTETIKRIRG